MSGLRPFFFDLTRIISRFDPRQLTDDVLALWAAKNDANASSAWNQRPLSALLGPGGPPDDSWGSLGTLRYKPHYGRPCRFYEPRTRPRHPWHAYEPARAASRRAEPEKQHRAE